ncbi:hypothetical protein MNBD_GAMMA16-2297 [hydrothermal vent metagenome]|uniref:Uncharacterized protein n=1 Tax=hydrothermal vent metagenome TaxID=652676 RepID=A0A3B0ZJP1_9ZZZZ
MQLNGLFCIMRTAWIKSTMTSEPWTKKVSVNPQKKYDYFLHFINRCQCFSKSINILLLSSFVTPLRAITMRSKPTIRLLFFLKLSLISRLILFLATARLSHFFETINPKRANAKSLGLYKTKNVTVDDRFAPSNTY